MRLAVLWNLVWRRADKFDRASLVFYSLAMVTIGIGFFVDIVAWVYLVVVVGILTTVARSFWGLRKSHQELQEVLARHQRQQEIEHFEWLYDASPDD